MIKANVVIEDNNWKKLIAEPSKYLKKRLKKIALMNNFLKKNNEFTILLSNNRKIQNLNRKYRKKNIKTDVLSFPLSLKNNKKYIGDIIISYEILKNRAKKTNFFFEFDKIWVHGLLHLYCYYHQKLKDYKLM